MIYTEDETIEIAQIASIMCSNGHLDKLYEKLSTGLLDCTNQIAYYALEFYKETKNVDWEDFIDNPEKYGFDKQCICWDDAILNYIDRKIKQL